MTAGATPPRGSQGPGRSGKAVVALFAAPFVLAFFGLAWTGVFPSHADGEGSTATAEAMCQAFTKGRLKAPATAQFDLAATGYDPNWMVAGTVDAENNVGSMVRSKVRCELTHETGTDTWQAVSVILE